MTRSGHGESSRQSFAMLKVWAIASDFGEDWKIGSWSSEQAQLRGLGNGGGSGGHVELGQSIGDVAMHGVLADAQAVGDGLIAQAARNQP